MRTLPVVVVTALFAAPTLCAQPVAHHIVSPPQFGLRLESTHHNPGADAFFMPADGQLSSVSLWVEDQDGAIASRSLRLRIFRDGSSFTPGEEIADYGSSYGTLDTEVLTTVMLWPNAAQYSLLTLSHAPVDVTEGERVWISIAPQQGQPGFFWVGSPEGDGFSTSGEGGIFTEGVHVRGVNLNITAIVTTGGGSTPNTCPSDISGDGVVNFSDLNAVLNNFGQTCD